MKHVVCYSGGHSSALVAIEVVRRFGPENVILLNHNINPSVELLSIKMFKFAVARYLGLHVTYVNMPGVESMDQFDVCMKAQGFHVGNHQALCTNRLKTEPFHKWLRDNFPVDEKTGRNDDVTIYYGFDRNEVHRITRRSGIMGEMGYHTDYPLALWTERTIHDVREIGIEPPLTYSEFKHANCIGCIKAGKQHWYLVYAKHPHIFAKAKAAEDTIGHSIIKSDYLDELEPLFAQMQAAGVVPTEHAHHNRFWADVNKALKQPVEVDPNEARPCECST